MTEIISHRYNDGDVEYLLKIDGKETWTNANDIENKSMISQYLAQLKKNKKKNPQTIEIKREMRQPVNIIKKVVQEKKTYFLTKFDGIEDPILVPEYNLTKMNSKLVDEYYDRIGPTIDEVKEYNLLQVNIKEYLMD